MALSRLALRANVKVLTHSTLVPITFNISSAFVANGNVLYQLLFLFFFFLRDLFWLNFFNLLLDLLFLVLLLFFNAGIVFDIFIFFLIKFYLNSLIKGLSLHPLDINLRFFVILTEIDVQICFTLKGDLIMILIEIINGVVFQMGK
jgi:hypothetical protein